jgi:hypothetical protein
MTGLGSGFIARECNCVNVVMSDGVKGIESCKTVCVEYVAKRNGAGNSNLEADVARWSIRFTKTFRKERSGCDCSRESTIELQSMSLFSPHYSISSPEKKTKDHKRSNDSEIA